MSNESVNDVQTRLISRIFPLMSQSSKTLRSRLLPVLLVALTSPLLLWQTSNLARYYALSSIHEQNRQTLNLIAANLKGELARFRDLPILLATFNRDIKNYLLSDRSSSETQKINVLLEAINGRAGSMDIYLMTGSGLTLAASNWNSPRPFIGKNFYYRPYFKQAMEGRLGKYYALGTTSNLRGYYYAYPIKDQGRILGVITVKMKVEFFEESWRASGRELIVQDNDGIIFLSTHPDWLYKSLTKLQTEDLKRIRDSRKYGKHIFSNVDVINRKPFRSQSETISINLPKTARIVDHKTLSEPEGIVEYLMDHERMDDAGWRVSILTSTTSADRSQTTAMLIASFIILTMIFLTAYIIERRRRIAQGLAIQEQDRRLLEKRVKERTLDLDATNRKLRKEISERELAEAELRKTQKELVQAGRLAAIGKLSAGISHELNQPLTAIRSYADNARAYLDRDNMQAAFSNLKNISELIDRMGRIIKNLRTYAAQDTKNLRPTSINLALDEALNLLQRRIETQNIAIYRMASETDLSVVAGGLRLQQVFVNLVSNALDAMADIEDGQLHIKITEEKEYVVIGIRDTGSGINVEELSHIFDPFFTTKDVGEGLGLGLSITYGIIKQFGGSIEVENHPEGGASFRIRLHRADKKANES